jgi:topoisomerase-4 subunit A
MYYITGFGVEQHFPDETVRVERYVPGKVYSVCYFDKEQNYYYMKRFQLELSEKMQSFLDDEGTMEFVAMTSVEGATLKVEYAGAHAMRPADEVDVDSFIGVKSHRAKGKRITTYQVESLTFIEPEPAEVLDATDEDVADDVLDVDLDSVGDVDVEGDVQPTVADDEPVIMLDSEQLNLF